MLLGTFVWPASLFKYIKHLIAIVLFIFYYLLDIAGHDELKCILSDGFFGSAVRSLFLPSFGNILSFLFHNHRLLKKESRFSRALTMQRKQHSVQYLHLISLERKIFPFHILMLLLPLEWCLLFGNVVDIYGILYQIIINCFF